MARGSRRAKYKSDSAILAKLIRDVKKNCYECSGDSLNEVKICEITDCALHPWRLGVPETSPKSSILDVSRAKPACKQGVPAKTIGTPVSGGGVT